MLLDGLCSYHDNALRTFRAKRKYAQEVRQFNNNPMDELETRFDWDENCVEQACGHQDKWACRHGCLG